MATWDPAVPMGELPAFCVIPGESGCCSVTMWRGPRESKGRDACGLQWDMHGACCFLCCCPLWPLARSTGLE